MKKYFLSTFCLKLAKNVRMYTIPVKNSKFCPNAKYFGDCLTFFTNHFKNIKENYLHFIKKTHRNSFKKLFSVACWESDPHQRPSFLEILIALDTIVHSSFTQTPHESFHTMQDDWRQEIEEVLLELRRKEKVTLVVVKII